MKKVLLRFYSAANLGDDLFVKIITARYKDQFTLASHQAHTPFGAIPNLRVLTSHFLTRLSYYAETYLGWNNLWLRLLARKHDLLVYIGGSIFMEHGNMRLWKGEEQFYKDIKKPYYILGSNFGPYQSPEFVDLTKRILSGAADMCFRDKASYDVFKDLPNVRVSTDIAFLLDTRPYQGPTEKMVIFSIIDVSHRFDDAITAAYEQQIRAMTKRFTADGYKVVYMSFCKREGDEAASERIRAGLDADTQQKVEVFAYSTNLDEALALMARCEVMVAARFHAMILGLLFGKKVLPMAYSDKTINILRDSQFPGQIVDIRKIDTFDGTSVDIQNLPVHDITKQIQLAEQQFQELDKVLTRNA